MAFERNKFLFKDESENVQVDGIPIGSFGWWFGPESTIPSDWVKLDGRTFDAEEYPSLYVALGTNTLPNLIGKSVRGADTPGTVYPELRLAGTSITEYMSDSEDYDDAHGNSTEVNAASITAIPIIKSGKGMSYEPDYDEIYYKDEYIDDLFDVLRARVTILERDTTNTSNAFNNHKTALDAHGGFPSTIDSSDLDPISDSINQIESTISDKEMAGNFYDDQAIDLKVTSLNQRLEPVETGVSNTRSTWLDHGTNVSAHSTLMSNKLATNDLVELQSQVNSLQTRITQLEQQ